METARIIYTMLWALIQYGDKRLVRHTNKHSFGYDGKDWMLVEHQCMSAGEDLCELLEEYGLAYECDGWTMALTEKGIELIDISEHEIEGLLEKWKGADHDLG